MAEDRDQERNLPASEKRLEQAREEGNVPRSRELSGALLMAVAGGLFLATGEGLSRDLARLTAEGLTFDKLSLDSPHFAIERFAHLGMRGFLAVAPWLGAMALAALAAPLALGSWNWANKGFTPDPSRLDPLKGIGRLFSIEALIELGKTIAKAALVGGIGAWVIWDGQAAIEGLASEGTPAAIAHLGSLLGKSFLFLAAGLALIAAIDVPLQLWRYHDGLRMTLEEAKREQKESEGDPHLKARVRSIQRERARSRMMAEVPKADVIVVNPTHYAVALAWRSSEMKAPKVVAKGTEIVAAKIREIAKEHGVPIVDAPPLARALHRHAEIGDEVPAALYQAVAQVLAYVFQLRRGARVKAPTDFDIPAGLDPHEGRA